MASRNPRRNRDGRGSSFIVILGDRTEILMDVAVLGTQVLRGLLSGHCRGVDDAVEVRSADVAGGQRGLAERGALVVGLALS